MFALVLASPTSGWATLAFESLVPGAHAIVVGDASTALEARRTGFEFRDTLSVLSAGPLMRFAFLFRKPVETTIVAQVLATGTGALNIAACRIPSGGEHFRTTVKGRTGGMIVNADHRKAASQGMFKAASSFEPTNDAGGRWPTNLVLVHGTGCQNVGIEEIQASQPCGRDDRVRVYMDGDPTSFICVPGCPIVNLDVTGGVSRFYPRFRDDAELLAWLTNLITPP